MGKGVRTLADLYTRTVEDPNTGCYIWQGSIMSNGYGQISYGGKHTVAHRLAWLLSGNTVLSQNMRLKHRCGNLACIRVEHIYPVWGVENLDDIYARTTINPATGCYEWKFGVNVHGYGVVRYNHKNMLATRLAWMFYHNVELTTDDNICHRCDNPACVNIEHLFLCNAKINYDDMRSKGRERHARGEKSGKAKLTDAAVREIRRRHADGETYTSIARKFGVSVTTIRKAAIGYCWAHVK